MGNWLGKKAQVHPRAQSSHSVRVKVRMSRTQLSELMSQVDLSEGNVELVPLILRECFEGRLSAAILIPGGSKLEKQLSTIVEET